MARNESWQPTSKRKKGFQASVASPARASVLAGPGRTVDHRGEAEGQRHDGRADDRGGQADQHRIADGRERDPEVGQARGACRATRKQSARAAASTWSCKPEMASRWVVPVRAKASLIFGIDVLALAEDQAPRPAGAVRVPEARSSAGRGKPVAESPSQRCHAESGSARVQG